MIDRLRIEKAVTGSDKETLVDIVLAACLLEGNLYRFQCPNKCGRVELFELRKALEGLFGHDIPTEEDDEDETD